jgi:CubicO group peptidase (beta-lactamase class C family)
MVLHRLLLAAVVHAAIAPPAAGQDRLTAAGLRDLDGYVAAGVKAWEIPGLAIAVVQGDSTVFAKGYGVRTMGSRARVGPHTLFANASTTKAFTALAALLLVDDGRLRLDEPATHYLPAFELEDPYASRGVTIRDLLTHRVGFPDPEFMWYGGPPELGDVLRRARFIRGTSRWQPAFAYNNLGYGALGAIERAAAGLPWDQLVRRRILDPLGMRETYMGSRAAAAQPDIATPHDRVDDTLRAIERYDLDNVAAAGAMYSTVSDMALWIRFLLDSGRVAGRRLVSDTGFTAMFTPQTLVSADEFYPTARRTHPHFTAYGLGWFLEDYRGELAVFHTGSIDGISAIVGLLPEHHAGVVIFANRDHAELRHALMYRVFDMVLGGPRRDWSAELKPLYDSLAQEARQAAAKEKASRVPNTHPSLALESYAGVYGDSLYGTAEVRREEHGLVLEQSPRLVADLLHWHYDTFRAVWRSRWLHPSLVTFRLGSDGTVAALDWGEGHVLARRAGTPVTR